LYHASRFRNRSICCVLATRTANRD